MTIREIKVKNAILWQCITQADTEKKIKIYTYNNIITIIIWRVWRYQRVIRILISKKNRQPNGKKKGQKDKQRL